MQRIQKKSIISSNSISWTVEIWKIKHFTEIKFHKLHTYNTIFLHKLYFTKSSTWFHLSNRIWELLILISFLLKTIILYYHRQGIIRFIFLDKPYKNKNEWNRMKLKTRLKRLFLWECSSVNVENPNILWWFKFCKFNWNLQNSRNFLSVKISSLGVVFLESTFYCAFSRILRVIKTFQVIYLALAVGTPRCHYDYCTQFNIFLIKL